MLRLMTIQTLGLFAVARTQVMCKMCNSPLAHHFGIEEATSITDPCVKWCHWLVLFCKWVSYVLVGLG